MNTISISDLRAVIDGRVIEPGDAEYDEARVVYSGGVDRRPAFIVRPANAADVSRVVNLARETGSELAVRSGGHSLPGYGVSEGGIVLDLRDMRGLEIDVKNQTAWVETGLTAGEYTAAAAEHGLATGFGDTGSVGIGGITVGGGVGYLSRKHGLTIDNLLAAEVVTADGEIRRADAQTNPDLFWAIRGGGGNFGVATRFQFKLYEIDQVLGGMLMLPVTADIICDFVAAAEAAPDELSTIANIMIAPPVPFLPAEIHGKQILMLLLVYSGDDIEEGQRIIAPFRSLAEPIADMIRPMRYMEMFTMMEGEAANPLRPAMETLFVNAIDRQGAEAIVNYLETSTAQVSMVQVRVLGGEIARVPPDETAFAHRDRQIMTVVYSMFARPEEASIHASRVHALADELRRSPGAGEPGAYVNFMGNEGEARTREAYPGSTWDRLTAIKDRYDPTNLFRMNVNIPPAASAK